MVRYALDLDPFHGTAGRLVRFVAGKTEMRAQPRRMTLCRMMIMSVFFGAIEDVDESIALFADHPGA